MAKARQISEKEHQRCFNCHSLGHFSTECPEPQMTLCYNCREQGHKTFECSRTLSCRHCGQVGHKERQCKIKKSGDPTIVVSPSPRSWEGADSSGSAPVSSVSSTAGSSAMNVNEQTPAATPPGLPKQWLESTTADVSSPNSSSGSPIAAKETVIDNHALLQGLLSAYLSVSTLQQNTPSTGTSSVFPVGDGEQLSAVELLDGQGSVRQASGTKSHFASIDTPTTALSDAGFHTRLSSSYRDTPLLYTPDVYHELDGQGTVSRTADSGPLLRQQTLAANVRSAVSSLLDDGRWLGVDTNKPSPRTPSLLATPRNSPRTAPPNRHISWNHSLGAPQTRELPHTHGQALHNRTHTRDHTLRARDHSPHSRDHTSHILDHTPHTRDYTPRPRGHNHALRSPSPVTSLSPSTLNFYLSSSETRLARSLPALPSRRTAASLSPMTPASTLDDWDFPHITPETRQDSFCLDLSPCSRAGDGPRIGRGAAPVAPQFSVLTPQDGDGLMQVAIGHDPGLIAYSRPAPLGDGVSFGVPNEMAAKYTASCDVVGRPLWLLNCAALLRSDVGDPWRPWSRHEEFASRDADWTLSARPPVVAIQAPCDGPTNLTGDLCSGLPDQKGSRLRLPASLSSVSVASAPAPRSPAAFSPDGVNSWVGGRR
eukprot:Gregarina_sp_Poly_1__153@NODE_1033_length_5290_cov_286_769864_g717_i0_p1_GENE_NODE_1033_length_5290_cov_286_769864_g717_i0NODE_1033_length_5290_cov_286_769864_g717_i0_p1_ORF_typecomplete_len653_score58_30zfCCHC/PF00098_23/0_00017zfCCHC/PF00098_23/1_3zfCCHC/PF00098_23/0_0095zfCCHC_3/PF13917_6/0_58zfCCHC_3/PF13917_6/0_0041zfCCHC_3/PF13917_6/0_14zfCCHC_4/PF14392_6/0_34zfCCHC_4/PF14392_6/1_1zfCCHC_4/PF14392_6/0_13zfCCHC_6/PF15288_6/1_6zfCCHC_6/PF15288_6/1e03zfCCHC_6/PF15288_6/0_41PHD_4/PF16866_5/0_1